MSIKNGTLPAPGVQSSGLRAEFLHITKIAHYFVKSRTVFEMNPESFLSNLRGSFHCTQTSLHYRYQLPFNRHIDGINAPICFSLFAALSNNCFVLLYLCLHVTRI